MTCNIASSMNPSWLMSMCISDACNSSSKRCCSDMMSSSRYSTLHHAHHHTQTFSSPFNILSFVCVCTHMYIGAHRGTSYGHVQFTDIGERERERRRSRKSTLSTQLQSVCAYSCHSHAQSDGYRWHRACIPAILTSHLYQKLLR
jgi:hypothetical protein